MTYVYSDSTAVVGPLAVHPEPYTYDLCEVHARGLTAPRGWELVRHEGKLTPPPVVDDLDAIAEAVREVGHPHRRLLDPEPDPTPSPGRRGHLRVVPS